LKSTVKPTVDKDFIKKVIDFNKYNQVIVQYYERYMNDVERSSWDKHKEEIICPPERKFMSIGKKVSLEMCNRYWTVDRYEKQKIKDVTRQNLCHDRFCSNCKKVKQAARMAKYIPEIKDYKDNLHHLVLTVPNCRGDDIDNTVKAINKAFRSLIMIIRGDDHHKIYGIDFSSWQYQGAMRSLEVTFKRDNFHPHLHVALIVRSGLFEDKHIINKFSYDHFGYFPELKNLFSKPEILIQKIWFLLVNKISVTAANIKDLAEGYSCMAKQFGENDFAELFKYMTKDKDEGGEVVTYGQWKALYQGLYRKKQIQGYGCLYQINDSLDMEEYDKLWSEYIEDIRKEESPRKLCETPEALLSDNQYEIISRKSYFNYLHQLYQE
jgi:hypothetical protein